MITARVAALVEELIHAEEVVALALKGLARPVPTWSVGGLKPPAAPEEVKETDEPR